MASETIDVDRRRDGLWPFHRIPVDRETLAGAGTVLPVIALYFMIAILPVSFAAYASLFEIPLLNPNWEFVGLANYTEVLTIDRFWGSLWTGVVYMVGSTLFQLVVGLWLALVLNRITRFQKVLTAVIFTAYLIPTIIVALVSLFMFDEFVGVFHIVGSEWLGLWAPNNFAIGSKEWAMPLLILIGSWKFAVFITIFALAQLRAIPSRFYEAAKVCGANKWQMFRDITLPRIQGVILVAVLLRSIFMFNKFDIIWIITQGGPGFATTTLPILAYREAFVGGSYGLGNAMAVVMFFFLAAGAVAYFKLFNPSEEVETST
jgi:multiple sugar transport system permease protein